MNNFSSFQNHQKPKVTHSADDFPNAEQSEMRANLSMNNFNFDVILLQI